MSSLAMSCAIVASLIGIILLGSITPASAYRSLYLHRDLTNDFITFSESAFENTTLYYATCENSLLLRNVFYPKWKKCVLHRVQANFEGGSPKVDSCKFNLHAAGPKAFVVRGFSKIDPLGKDRAIVRWAVSDDPFKPPHLYFTVVNFSNCEVEWSSRSDEKDQVIRNKYFEREAKSVNGVFRVFFSDYRPDYSHNREFDWPIYLKGEDDFEILLIKDADRLDEVKSVDVLKLPFETELFAEETEPWFTYAPKYSNPVVPYFFPLSKSEGHLFIAIEETRENCNYDEDCHSMTVALVQPNGQRQNLTRIEGFDFYSEPMVSLANGMIGICAQQTFTTMQCTQFRLDDKQIKWFSTSIIWEQKSLGLKRGIYNLPRGEGFLTHVVSNVDNLVDKYLLKIGLDGKVKQFLEPGMRCRINVEAGFNKIFEDDRGNYCVSSVCVRNITSDLVQDFDESGYIKLRSKCFEPEDFKDVSKYIIDDQKETLLIE
uniref:Uncharacterized protein n=1 Tax=Trichogramma kaykai TaxID=54128 RepID=A0ABD2XCE4_9HYME